MVFFTTAHLGEFTIPTLKGFDASRHIKPSDIFMDTDHNGLKSRGFHLPVTKLGGPEDVSFSAQTGRVDLESALMSLLIRYAHIPFYFRFSFAFPTSSIYHYAPPLQRDRTRSHSHSLPQTDLAYLMDI